MKLTKSLADLEAAADELLAKSKAAEDKKDDIKKDDVTPEEISDDSVTSMDAEDADTEEKTEDTDTKKTSDESKDKKDETVEKSEDTETVEDETEDDDSEDSEEEDEEEEETSPEDVEKSVKEDFESNDNIKKGMDTSEFLSAVVEVLSKSMGDVQYDVVSGNKNHQRATDVLAKSLQASLATNKALQAENEKLTRRMNKLEKSISMGFEKVMDVLDDISSQPAGMRKSMVSVHDRDFDRSINGTKTYGGAESLSKSQVLDILNNELYAGNPSVTPSDIISYESGAPLRPNLQSIVANKCK